MHELKMMRLRAILYYASVLGLAILVFNRNLLLSQVEAFLLINTGTLYLDWSKRYAHDITGPRILRNPFHQLRFFVCGWGAVILGLIMIASFNKTCCCICLGAMFLRHCVRAYHHSEDTTIRQIVSAYKRLTALYPSKHPSELCRMTMGEVLAQWGESDYEITSALEHFRDDTVQGLVDFLLVRRERYIGRKPTPRDIRGSLREFHKRQDQKKLVEKLLAKHENLPIAREPGKEARTPEVDPFPFADLERKRVVSLADKYELLANVMLRAAEFELEFLQQRLSFLKNESVSKEQLNSMLLEVVVHGYFYSDLEAFKNHESDDSRRALANEVFEQRIAARFQPTHLSIKQFVRSRLEQYTTIYEEKGGAYTDVEYLKCLKDIVANGLQTSSKSKVEREETVQNLNIVKCENHPLNSLTLGLGNLFAKSFDNSSAFELTGAEFQDALFSSMRFSHRTRLKELSEQPTPELLALAR